MQRLFDSEAPAMLSGHRKWMDGGAGNAGTGAAEGGRSDDGACGGGE